MNTKEKGNVDLLNGSISLSLTKLALPIMATAFLQMGYNLIDMIWIGRVGSDAVSAVGVGSMFVWLANGIIMMARIGGQVNVGQQIGAKNHEGAALYAKTAFQMTIVAAVIYGIICLTFHESLVSFFQFENQQIAKDAEYYIMITCGCIIFYYINQIFTGMFTALGNSKVTLLATLTGLSINIVLDPVLIFGIGPFPELGVRGAAIATVFAQFIVFNVFLRISRREQILFEKIRKWKQFDRSAGKKIIRIGFPAGIQSMTFTVISMILSRMITGFGDTAIAVQKVGTQVESISWMTAEGFGTAVNAFTAQNYGANKENRVNRGYRVAMTIMVMWGAFTSFVLITFPGAIFQIFIQEEAMLQMGIDYLRIMGYSQLLMCLELATAGAFQGLGKTLYPSINGIVWVLARIPLAYMLSSTSLGLNGIWWAITISAGMKGLILPTWFILYRRKQGKVRK